MQVLIGSFLLCLFTNVALGKEVVLSNKSIRFFNSDIEFSKFLISTYEDYEFSNFSKADFKKFSSRFDSNLRYKDFKVGASILNDLHTLKDDSKIISSCKNIKDIDDTKNSFKFRLSVYCFNKVFSSKMSKESFYRLSSAVPLARLNKRILNQINNFNNDTKTEQIVSDNKVTKTESQKFIALVKKIRNLSHSAKKDTDEFTSQVKALFKLLDDSDNIKNLDNVEHMTYLVKTLDRHNKFKESREFSKFMIENTKYEQDNFYFQLLWSYVSRNEYKSALKKVINKFGLNFNYKTFDNSRLKFWIAHTLEVNELDSASQIYQDIVDNSPLSFYALLSYNRIKNDKKDSKVSLIDKDSKFTENYKFNLSKKSMDQLSFIRALIVNNSIFMLADEISLFLLENTKKDLAYNRQLYISLAKFMQSNGNYLESFKIVYRGINKKYISVNENVLKLLYPRPYLSIISKQNKEFDSYLALSLMRQESSFNNLANSSVGAKGLMQLMPNTAKAMRKSVTIDELYNPKMNIKLGVQYLNGLNSKFDKNFVHMLSAYNAGERNLKRWKKNYFISDTLLKNIENIPFYETRKYVKLIFRNIFYYNYLDKIEGREPATDTNRLFEKYLQVKR